MPSYLNWHIFSAIFLVALGIVYFRGWRRMKRALPEFATYRRGGTFFCALTLLALAQISPLDSWSNFLLTARATQKVLLGMLVPPLFWLACPFHIMLWGLSPTKRRLITRWLLRPGRIRNALRWLLRPFYCWLIFVAAFFSWHDPMAASWLLQHSWSHTFTLWGLWGTATLYWWHVVDTGPRIHRSLLHWQRVGYLLSAELCNMIVGITIAFSTVPVYHYYLSQRMGESATYIGIPLTLMEDQMLSGAVAWVGGSIIYIGTTLIVLRLLFIQEGALYPQPYANWDDPKKLIAPGLEHRASQDGTDHIHF